MCLLLDANLLRYAGLFPSMKKVKLNTPRLIKAPEALSLQGQIGLPLRDYRLSNAYFTMPAVLLMQEQQQINNNNKKIPHNTTPLILLKGTFSFGTKEK